MYTVLRHTHTWTLTHAHTVHPRTPTHRHFHQQTSLTKILLLSSLSMYWSLNIWHDPKTASFPLPPYIMQTMHNNEFNSHRASQQFVQQSVTYPSQTHDGSGITDKDNYLSQWANLEPIECTHRPVEWVWHTATWQNSNCRLCDVYCCTERINKCEWPTAMFTNTSSRWTSHQHYQTMHHTAVVQTGN